MGTWLLKKACCGRRSEGLKRDFLFSKLSAKSILPKGINAGADCLRHKLEYLTLC
jgi:hypothetical protein